MIETSSPKFWRSLVFTGLCRNPSVSDERSRLCAARRPGVLTLWLVFMLLPSNQVSVARLLRLCVSRWDEDSPGTKLAHSPPISVFSVSQDSLVGCVRFAHIHLRCHVFHCFKLAFPGSWWFGPKWRCVIIICDPTFFSCVPPVEFAETGPGRVGGLVVGGENSSQSRPIPVWKG